MYNFMLNLTSNSNFGKIFEKQNALTSGALLPGPTIRWHHSPPTAEVGLPKKSVDTSLGNIFI